MLVATQIAVSLGRVDAERVSRLRAQLAVRQALYDQADGSIDTEGRSLTEVATLARAALVEAQANGRLPLCSIDMQSGRSDIYVRRGAATSLPGLLRSRWPRARRCWLIVDEQLGERWRAPLREQLDGAGFTVTELSVGSGEGSKSLAEVARLCDALTSGGATRRDVVLALGGGVVGDLAGFVAAVALRGLPLAQLPTSLLAMVDASVGGKTGVNMPAGKNLVGAFYPAGIVAVDPCFLDTLPTAEYRSGMAEVIKHALIQPATPLGGSTLLDAMRQAPSLDPLPPDAIERVLALNVALKASVVRADERESGLRMILNFGHTAGHAIEADGYRFRHGEAVALGMLVATQIAVSLGRVDAERVSRLRQLLERAGLPTRCGGRVEEILQRINRDKKNVDGAVHWILPSAAGGVEVVRDVPLAVVREALLGIGAA
jgi:3-dehydroquinate synthase